MDGGRLARNTRLARKKEHSAVASSSPGSLSNFAVPQLIDRTEGNCGAIFLSLVRPRFFSLGSTVPTGLPHVERVGVRCCMVHRPLNGQ